MHFDTNRLSGRDKAVVLVARQIAIDNGVTWSLTPDGQRLKAQLRYLTLARNILATFERVQKEGAW